MSSHLPAGSQPGSASVAVLLPGVRYTAQAPLLYWCGQMLSALGWHVEAVEWTIDEAALEDPQRFVELAVDVAFDAAPEAARRLIVAKSFGTYALPWARRRGIPGVWLTPILTDDAILQGLRGATSADIAIGGTADRFWLPDAIEDTEARLISVPGANHSLEIPGEWSRSLAVQNDIFLHIARHLERSVITPSG